MTSKTAAVFALDVSCCRAHALEQGRQVCVQSALEKMLYAPHDELGLIFTGTKDTMNPLASSTPGRRYKHITVERALAATTVDFLTPLEALRKRMEQGGGSSGEEGVCDILETIEACANLIVERTAKKKYSRLIYLITDARHEVASKGAIQDILQLLQRHSIALIVIGIDFTVVDEETSAVELLKQLDTYNTKGQNEVVLHALCQWLGESSMVISLEEAVEGLSALRRRKVLQRPLLKVSLGIGDVRIAAQLFTKTQEEKLPSLKRATAGGEEVTTVAEYVRIVGGDSSATPFAAAVGDAVETVDRVKAYHYGRSLIPCTEGDLEAMKIPGPRSLSAVAFVLLSEIPPYILMGGTRVLLPLAGDHVGQKGFSALVRAMAECEKAMIVRLVRTRDAKPVLGVCVPSSKAGKRDTLNYAPLPFAEDVRQYTFSEYEDIVGTQPEQQLLDALVSDMTVGKDTLRPNETFNPVLAQYYATLRVKAVKRAREEPLDRDGDVPPLIPQSQCSSTAFTSYGNPISEVLQAVQPKLEDCAAAFPYVAPDAEGQQKQRGYWFRIPANVALTPEADDVASSIGRAPSTINALTLQQMNTIMETGSSISETPTIPIRGLSGPVPDRVSTIDPVGSFHALVAAREKDLLGQQRAMDELVETVFQLLRHSLKDAFYRKCDDCVGCLRVFCVQEGDPDYYNGFLIKLLMVAKELGHEEGYWERHVASAKSLRPITRGECPTSSLADESAAASFLTQDRSLPPQETEEVLDDTLLDLIS